MKLDPSAVAAIRTACKHIKSDRTLLGWARSTLDIKATIKDIVEIRKTVPVPKGPACRQSVLRSEPIIEGGVNSHREMMERGSASLLRRMIDTGCTWRRA